MNDDITWLAFASLAIAFLARAAKAPAIGSPFARVPVRWRPHVVLALGVLSGVLDAVMRGTPWVRALGLGLVSAAVAIAGHGAVGGLDPHAPAPAPEEDVEPIEPAPPTPRNHGGTP